MKIENYANPFSKTFISVWSEILARKSKWRIVKKVELQNNITYIRPR